MLRLFAWMCQEIVNNKEKGWAGAFRILLILMLGMTGISFATTFGLLAYIMFADIPGEFRESLGTLVVTLLRSSLLGLIGSACTTYFYKTRIFEGPYFTGFHPWFMRALKKRHWLRVLPESGVQIVILCMFLANVCYLGIVSSPFIVFAAMAQDIAQQINAY